ncbi:hypothetical protein RIF29_00665 [Crotalaria pallida]|uniref:Uncharacterized protein n=1 Tax=Crotalaria pallida TaxID=3830 RepID=A0AAN9IW24_CROPI
MAKKRGRPPKTPTNHPSPSSTLTQKVDSHNPKSQNTSANPLPINLELLDDQETKFRELFESLDSLNEQQVNALLDNMDRIREKIKGKKPIVDEVNHSGQKDATGPSNPTLGQISPQEILQVVETVKTLDQIKEGLIEADRVEESELHPAVVESTKEIVQQSEVNKGQSGVEKDSKEPDALIVKNGTEDQWHTITTRRRVQLQKKEASEGGRSSPSLPANG